MDKKIVFLINTLKVGGAAKMLKYVANLSTEVFNNVSIISLYDDNYGGSDLNNKIKVICLKFGQINRIKRQFIMVPKTMNTINKINPDYVFSFISHVCFIGRLATLKNKRIKYLSAERGDPFTEPLIWKMIIKWTYSKSDYCFFQLEKARDFYGKNIASKSFVIPNPFFLNKPVEPYNGPRRKTIVSAGRFGKEKRYCDLIKAFSIVHNKYPEYSLVLYGNGPLLESYKKQVANLKLNDFVEFPGYVDCFSEHIRKDGIFVLSSLFEGIPNSLIEAMSVGIPCISTDCTPGGPAYLFNGHNRGILVPVKNPHAIAEAIIYYIENPKIAKEKGNLAINIIEQLKEDRIHNDWINSFNRIIYDKI